MILSIINLYDFIYSFIFQVKEYNDFINDDQDRSTSYKWSYSMSFAISHLILLALCCTIEFIVVFDNQTIKMEIEKYASI